MMRTWASSMRQILVYVRCQFPTQMSSVSRVSMAVKNEGWNYEDLILWYQRNYKLRIFSSKQTVKITFHFEIPQKKTTQKFS